MTPGERQLRADAARNRLAIVQAAEAEFRARGVDASIDAIAERAGVGVGTLYRNYATKDELMRAILAARAEPLVAAAQEALTDPDAGAAFFGFVRRLFSEFRRLQGSRRLAGGSRAGSGPRQGGGRRRADGGGSPALRQGAAGRRRAA